MIDASVERSRDGGRREPPSQGTPFPGSERLVPQISMSATGSTQRRKRVVLLRPTSSQFGQERPYLGVLVSGRWMAS